ncbi:PREDICTED: ankyrin repeat domain-containing protein 26-like [Capra hircus]|uniref:ankyrin repeat domain-containing protein 26-like n=1 Tax=Capra hircus TaxID=9925 RepID=UPI000846472B|nr:PREDICTED: ankyrin repeat domain-containing protein 26-like [Capra hircus]
MKKSFGFRRKKGISPFGSSVNPVRDSGHRINFRGPCIQDKDLGKIHKAASVGNVAKVQQVLLPRRNGLNDREKMNRFPNKPGVDLGPTSDDEVLDFKTKEGATKSELVAKESDTDIIDRAPQDQTNHDHLSSVDGAHKNTRSDMLSALGLGEEEDIESPWDSESISESLPQKYVDHLSGTAGERGKKTLNGQVEDVTYIPSCMSGSRNFKMAKLEEPRHVGKPVAHMDSPEKYPNMKPAARMKDYVPNKTVRMKDLRTSELSTKLDLEMISEEEQEKLDGDENNHSQIEEEKKHKSSEVEVSDSVCNAADESGLIQQRKSGGNSNQEFPAMENEDSDSNPGVHKKEVKKKNNDKRTPEECVIVPVFEKTDSLTGDLLHVNDDSILREVHQDDDRPARKTPYEKKKVKEQMNYVNDLDDLTQSSEMVSEDGDALCSTNSTLQAEPLDLGCEDSGSLLKIQDAIFSHDRLVDFQRKHCELLRGEIHRMKSKFCELQKELSETKEVKSQLEHQKVEWEQEHRSLRFTLKQEEENRRNANMLYEKTREQLRRNEDKYSKEVEMKQQLELSLRALEMELKTVTNNQSQASAGPEEPKDLLCKNQMLQDEIAMLKLEIDTVKNQNLEKEKNYFEDIEIVKAKNDDAQKAIKLNEERLTKTISQYTGQLNVLTAENIMLKSKLENEKENKQRLETEVESYRSRLAAAFHDHDQDQTSQRDLELAFQKAKDEWLCLQDKMKSDVANLKEKNEALSQQLSTAESKFHQVKIKLQHTRDNLREKTLMLERVQRDLRQAECQKQETEHMYQNEQGKVNKYLGKQDSLEETLSQLQSENMLLRQQLGDTQNKANSKEKTDISIQDQFQQIVRKLHAENEKQGLILEERNKELIQERNHLKERMYQYENEKTEREVIVRQLQQELADALQKKSMSEASLEIMSSYWAKLEAETQDFKNNLHQPTSQIQAGSQQMELRIKDLESELSKMKTLQEDSNKAELEKYKHLYLVELEVRKSLQDKLDKTDERLIETRAELEVEKQQNRSIHSTLSTRPVLESSSVGNFNPASGFNTNVISRANRGFSTSIPCPSNDSMETYLTKMQQELDRSITREIRKVDAEFASDAFTVSQVSADGSNVYDEQILKTKAQYTQILKEKFMI